MKKKLTAVVAVLMALSLSACSPDKAKEEGKKIKKDLEAKVEDLNDDLRDSFENITAIQSLDTFQFKTFNSQIQEIISQIEFSAEGIGNPALDPYEFVSAGLYDIHDGEIGTGNEKGIAFSRDAASMAGFSRIDFGSTGSDTMILPVFALDGKPYEMELFDGDPRSGGKLISLLHYEKPSIWNVYQEAVYKLPVRLKGVHCLCFRMKQKVHLKGFRFEKQSRAFLTQLPGDADAVYGDSFVREGNTIHHIGNNVSLIFHEMDFGDRQDCRLMIRGKTDLPLNSITVRIRDVHGETRNEVVDFRGGAGEEQSFAIRVPGGICTVTFVFLPGSSFDFDAFRFE